MTITKTIASYSPLIGIAFILYMLAGYLYWPAINGGLVWDDPALISRHGLLNTREWFHNSFGIAFLSDAYYYRPMPLLTLIWNGAFGAEHFLFLSHLTNVVIFCMNITLVMVLTFKVTSGDFKPTAMAGLLYSVHPALIESVAWISGRCDLLLTFFVLLAFYFDITLKNNFKLRTILVSLSFLFAALSKEAAIVFPAILLCWNLYFYKIDFSLKSAIHYLKTEKNTAYFIFIILTGVVYLVIRITFLGSLFSNHPVTNYTDNVGGLYSHFLLIMKTFSWYWLLQLFPHYDLSAIYHTAIPVTANDYAAGYGVLLIALLLFLLKTGSLTPRSKYGLVMLTILFLPVSNLKPILAWDNFIHLRYLTLSISCLIIIYTPIFMQWLTKQRKQLQAIMAGAALIWCAGSIINVSVTVPLWSHEHYLWKWVTNTKPDSYLAWDNYAAILLAEKDYGNCADAAEQSIKLNHASGKAYVTAAQCYYEKKDFQSARRLSDMALHEQPQMEAATYSSLLTTSALLDIKSADTQTSHEKITAKLAQALMHNSANNRARYLLIAWYIRTGNNALAETLAEETSQQKSNATITIDNVMMFIASEAFLDARQGNQLRAILVATQNERL